MYHIAVVDDDREFSSKVQEYLDKYQQENGEKFEVEVFYDGAKIIENYTPDHPSYHAGWGKKAKRKSDLLCGDPGTYAPLSYG